MTLPAKDLPINCQKELSNLASNIKLARKRRRITLEDMAEKTSTSKSTISRLEAGDSRVSIETLLKVLNVLGLLRGLSNFVSPESDSEQIMSDIKELRIGKSKRAKPIFSPSELEF